jgi:hypothetical protein
MRRGIVVSAGVAALVVSLAGASAAGSAQKAKVSGPEKVFVIPATTAGKHPGKILLAGTIADYGTTVNTNASGKPTHNGGYAELDLKKGSIFVDLAGLDKAITKAFTHATFDKVTCSISAAATGAVTIVSGTKAYAGIKGSFMLSGNIAEIGPSVKGVCTTKTTTPAVATFTEFTGSGTVSLP